MNEKCLPSQIADSDHVSPSRPVLIFFVTHIFVDVALPAHPVA